MEKLPIGIRLEIISRLPVESVFQCKQVCRSWQSSINLKDPWFTQMHLHHQLMLQQHNAAGDGGGGVELGFISEYGNQLWYRKYDDQSFKTLSKFYFPIRFAFLVGSCNGLICLGTYNDDDEVQCSICNPITRELIDIPGVFMGSKEEHWVYGFGYHPSINEYKVVRVVNASKEPREPPARVQVYTLGDASGWRDKGEIPYHAFHSEEGVLFNGELHWIIQGGGTVAFNLENEQFHFIASAPLEEPHSDWDDHHDSLRVLGGQLCLVRTLWNMYLPDIELWFLNTNSSSHEKKEKGTQSWSKEFTVPVRVDGGNITPLALTKRGEHMFVQLDGCFYRYSLKNGIMEELIDDKRMVNYDVIPHINSFVSLKALGEVPREG